MAVNPYLDLLSQLTEQERQRLESAYEGYTRGWQALGAGKPRPENPFENPTAATLRYYEMVLPDRILGQLGQPAGTRMSSANPAAQPTTPTGPEEYQDPWFDALSATRPGAAQGQPTGLDPVQQQIYEDAVRPYGQAAADRMAASMRFSTAGDPYKNLAQPSPQPATPAAQPAVPENLTDLTVKQLRSMASELGIEGRSKLARKGMLVAALNQATGRTFSQEKFEPAVQEAMRWGWTREETYDVLSAQGLTHQASEEAAVMSVQAQAQREFGEMPGEMLTEREVMLGLFSGRGPDNPPRTEEGHIITPIQWRHMQEQGRARHRGALHAVPKGESRPPGEGEIAREELEPKQWREGYFTRQGASSLYPISALTGAGYWLAGEQPGSVRLPSSIGEGKEQKRGQQLGAFESMGAHRLQPETGVPGNVVRENLERYAPFKMGPEAQTRERGISLRAAIPLVDVTPPGQSLLKPGAVSAFTERWTRDIPLPEGLEPSEMPEEGTRWAKGEPIVPFKGAGEIDIGSWSAASLLSRSIMEGEGGERTMRMLFERELDPGRGEQSIKMLGHKTTLPQARSVEAFERFVGGQQDIEAVLQAKEPLGIAAETMLNLPKEQLTEILGEGYEKGTWQEHAPKLIEHFRQAAPEMIRDIPYNLEPMSREEFEAIPEERRERWFGEVTQREGMYHVTTKPIPTLVPETGIFTAVKREYPGRQPFIPYRELQRIQRTDPEQYARIMEEAQPQREAYGAMIRASHLTSIGAQAPSDVQQLTPERAGAIIAGAERRALERWEDAAGDVTKVPSAIMQRAVMEQLAESMGGAPIELGKGQYMADPNAIMRLGAAPGALAEGAYGGLERAATRVVSAAIGQEEMPETHAEAVQGFLRAQADIGESPGTQRRAMGAPIPRTGSEGTVHGTTALRPHERYRPAEEVLGAYGLKQGTPEYQAAYEQWGRGELQPLELGSRFPPAGGDQPMQMRYSLLHPSELEKRGVILDPKTRLIVSQLAQQAAQGDFDADRQLREVVGSLVQNEEGTFSLEGGQVASTAEDVMELAKRAPGWGAAALHQEEFLQQVGKQGDPVKAMLDILDPSTYREMSGEQLREKYASDLALRQQIGPIYNIVDPIEEFARRGGAGEEQVAATAKLFGIAYGVAQRPAELEKVVPQIGRTMDILRTGSAATGGFWAEGKGGWLGARGFAGAMRGMAQSLMATTRPGTSIAPGDEEGSLQTSREVAALLTPLGASEEEIGSVAELIQKAQGPGTSMETEAVEQQIFERTGLLRRESAFETTLGRTAMPLLLQQAQKYVERFNPEEATPQQQAKYAKSQELLRGLGLGEGQTPTEFGGKLQAASEAISARKAALSKFEGFGERMAGAREEAPDIWSEWFKGEEPVGAAGPEAVSTAQATEQQAAQAEATQQQVIQQQPTAAVRPAKGEFVGTGTARTVRAGGGTLEDVQRREAERERKWAGERAAQVRPAARGQAVGVDWDGNPVDAEGKIVQGAPPVQPAAAGVGGGGVETPAAAAAAATEQPSAGGGQGGWQPRVSVTEMVEAVTGLEMGLPRYQQDIVPRIRADRPLSPEDMQAMRRLKGYRATVHRGVEQGTALGDALAGHPGIMEKAAALIGEGELGEKLGITPGMQSTMASFTGQWTRAQMGAMASEFEGGQRRVEEAAPEIGRLNESLTAFSENLDKATQIVGRNSEQMEKHTALTREQVQEQRWAAQQASQVIRDTERLQGLRPEGGLTTEQQEAFVRAQAVQQQIKLQGALPPGGGEGGGGGLLGQIGAGAAGIGQKLMSGWGLMQLQRMWRLTGGQAMAAIPVAAQAEQAAVGAAAIGMPQDQYVPGEMGMGLMQYQAQRQNFQIGMGRGAYGAWGWAQQALPQGVGTLAGIAGPAAGAGLMGGLLANWGGAAAGVAGLGIPVGAAVGSVAGAAGGAFYLGQLARNEEQMAIAAAGGGQGIQGFLGQAALATRLFPGAAGSFLGNIVAGMAGPVGDLGALTTQGQRIMAGELGAPEVTGRAALVPEELRKPEARPLAGRSRVAAIQYAAQNPPEELSFLNEEALTTALGDWMKWNPEDTNVQEIMAKPEFQQMAMRGNMPGEFEAATKLGQAWGIGPFEGQQRMRAIMKGRNLPEQMQMGANLETFAGWARFGISPEQIGERMGTTQPGAEGLAMNQALLGGQSWAWSQLGEQEGRPEWQTERGGFQIGTNWGGRILQSQLRNVGWSGQQVLAGMQMRGGTEVPGLARGAGGTMAAGFAGPSAGQVMIGGEAVDFNQWALQDFGMQKAQEQRQWQYGFQMQGLQQGRQFQERGWGLQDQMTGLQRGWQETGLQNQEASTMMSLRQTLERLAQSGQRLGVQSRWGEEDIRRGYERQQTQFGWAREDLAFRGQQTTLQFGWQMEDLEESERFATGRQRRQIRRQQERATVSYGMQMGRLDTEEDRLGQREQWAEEDFDRELERHEQRTQWSRQDIDTARRHAQERAGLAMEHIQETRDYYAEVQELQDKQRDLQREEWLKNYERQVAALTKQKEYQDLQAELQEKENALARSQMTHVNDFADAFKKGGTLRDATESFIDWMIEYMESKTGTPGVP